MSRERMIRLIQCIVVPVVGMVAAGRLAGWLLVRLGMTLWAADLGSFLVSALTAAFLYRCLDPEGWKNGFHETVGTPCPLPAAFCHVGYSILWLMAVMAAVDLLFPAPELSVRPLAGAVLSAVAVHPLLEEWLFRRVFLARLLDLADGEPPAAEVVPENGGPVPCRKYSRAGQLFAVLTQAVLFALMHSGGGAMLYGFGGGVVLGILMLHTGRLWVPVTVHMVINLRAVVWPMLPETAVNVLDPVLITLGLLCGGYVWVRRIRKRLQTGKEDRL